MFGYRLWVASGSGRQLLYRLWLRFFPLVWRRGWAIDGLSFFAMRPDAPIVLVFYVVTTMPFWLPIDMCVCSIGGFCRGLLVSVLRGAHCIRLYSPRAAAAVAGAASIWPLAFVVFAATFGHIADPYVSLRLGFCMPCAAFGLPLAPLTLLLPPPLLLCIP